MTTQYEFPITNSVAEASIDYRFANTNKSFEDEVYEPVSCLKVTTNAVSQAKPVLPEPNPSKATKKPQEDNFKFKWILIVVAIAVVVNTVLAAAALGIAVQAGSKMDQVKIAVDELKRNITAITTEVTQISSQQIELKRTITQISSRQDVLNSRLGKLTQNITSSFSDVWHRLNNVPIRLVGGVGSKVGRVEIFHDGLWGTICDDIIDYNAGDVMCRLLGFSYVSVFGNVLYQGGSGQIWLDDLSCSGTETTLEDCDHNGWGVHNCNHNEDLSIKCI